MNAEILQQLLLIRHASEPEKSSQKVVDKRSRLVQIGLSLCEEFSQSIQNDPDDTQMAMILMLGSVEYARSCSGLGLCVCPSGKDDEVLRLSRFVAQSIGRDNLDQSKSLEILRLCKELYFGSNSATLTRRLALLESQERLIKYYPSTGFLTQHIIQSIENGSEIIDDDYGLGISLSWHNMSFAVPSFVCAVVALCDSAAFDLDQAFELIIPPLFQLFDHTAMYSSNAALLVTKKVVETLASRKSARLGKEHLHVVFLEALLNKYWIWSIASDDYKRHSDYTEQLRLLFWCLERFLEFDCSEDDPMSTYLNELQKRHQKSSDLDKPSSVRISPHSSHLGKVEQVFLTVLQGIQAISSAQLIDLHLDFLDGLVIELGIIILANMRPLLKMMIMVFIRGVVSPSLKCLSILLKVMQNCKESLYIYQGDVLVALLEVNNVLNESVYSAALNDEKVSKLKTEMISAFELLARLLFETNTLDLLANDIAAIESELEADLVWARDTINCLKSKAIFKGDFASFMDIMEKIEKERDEMATVSKWFKPDHHGNTPLHIAVNLGQKGMIKVLLDAGHPCVTAWNEHGWNALDDAIAYGDIDNIMMLMEARDNEISNAVKSHLPGLLDKFHNTLGDFYMEINMDFQTWVPFLSRFCPKDTFKIWKRGSSVRLDHTLIGLEGTKWQYANVSTIFFVDPEHGPVVISLNHDKKVMQQVYPLKRLPQFDSPSYSARTQRKLDVFHLVTTSLSQIEINTEKMVVKQHRSISQNISSFFRRRNSAPASVDDEDGGEAIDVSKVGVSSNKTATAFCTERIGKYLTQRYNINNLEVKTKLRLEHLSDMRIAELGIDAWFANAVEEGSKHQPNHKNSSTLKERESVEKFLKKVMDESKNSQKDASFWEKLDLEKFALAPPEECEQITFEEYFGLPEVAEDDSDSAIAPSPNSVGERPTNIGRPFRLRNHTRPMRLRLWMSGDYLSSERDSSKSEIFPWKLAQLLTLLDVLDLGNSNLGGTDGTERSSGRTSFTPLGQFKNFLRLSGIENGFPVQMEVPMFGVFVAQVRFMEFMALGENSPVFDVTNELSKTNFESASKCFQHGFFSIPSDYTIGEVYPHIAKK